MWNFARKILSRFIIDYLMKHFGGLFHVEHERGEPRRFASLVLFFVIDRRYLPNFTSKTFTSAGETPGIREAWPIVVGRMRVSFCRASIVSDCIE